MDRLLGSGIAIGFFISGVAALLINISLQLGIVLIILAIILGLLFMNPKSPVRKYWWSVSGKLGVLLLSKMGISDKYLTIYVGLRAISVIRVEKIHLKIGRKLLLSDWKPTRVEADEQKYINFERPYWLHTGEYKARLIAHTPDGFSKSEKFLIKVDN